MSEPIVPTAEQQALLAGLPADQPVVMINLLGFRQPDGATHYGRYAREVQPHLESVGARAIYAGTTRGFLIGEGARPWWDAILVVEYPTPSAFVQMTGTAEYAAVHEHRARALQRAELIATTSWGLES